MNTTPPASWGNRLQTAFEAVIFNLTLDRLADARQPAMVGRNLLPKDRFSVLRQTTALAKFNERKKAAVLQMDGVGEAESFNELPLDVRVFLRYVLTMQAGTETPYGIAGGVVAHPDEARAVFVRDLTPELTVATGEVMKILLERPHHAVVAEWLLDATEVSLDVQVHLREFAGTDATLAEYPGLRAKLYQAKQKFFQEASNEITGTKVTWAIEKELKSFCEWMANAAVGMDDDGNDLYLADVDPFVNLLVTGVQEFHAQTKAVDWTVPLPLPVSSPARSSGSKVSP